MKSIRVAHITDIHFQTRPRFFDLFGKRLLGSANLYLLGRRKQFSPGVQTSLIKAVYQRKPDLLLITGDLTAQSLETEYYVALRSLLPLLRLPKESKFYEKLSQKPSPMFQVPGFIIPGNHDVYTFDSFVRSRFYRWFRSWMYLPFELKPEVGAHGDLGDLKQLMSRSYKEYKKMPRKAWASPESSKHIAVYTIGHVTVVGLNPCRPTKLFAQGYYPPEQLDSLHHFLNTGTVSNFSRTLGPDRPQLKFTPPPPVDLSKQFIVLATHYPVVDAQGGAYHVTHPRHAATNTNQLIEVLRAATFKPHLIVHGHEHHGYTAKVSIEPPVVGEPLVTIPSHNPGSGGLSYQPSHQRVAAFNIYDISPTKEMTLQRYVHNGSDFYREPTPYSVGTEKPRKN